MSKKSVYRITYANLDSVYEIYARKIQESDIFGFLVVEDFVFGENSSVVVDPGEERLKLEFSQVKRTLIPVQSVYRIDEVEKEGIAKVREKSIESGKVTHFPVSGKNK